MATTPYAQLLRRVGLLAMVSLSLCFVACGDSQVQTNTKLSDRKTDAPDNPPDFNAEFFLAANGSTSLSVNVGSRVPIEVFLYDKKNNNPVPEQSIEFEIVETAANDVGLTSKNGVTSTDGSASVDLRTGSETGVLKIKAKHPSANEVEFTISVDSLPTGEIEVKTINAAPSVIALKDIEVQLHDYDGYSCAEFRPLSQQPQGMGLFVIPTEQDLVNFADVAVDKKYVVTAIARGPRGQRAAGGCVEDIRVDANDTSRVEVALQLIPINPVGRYKVTSNWDFTKALEDSGSIGSTIVRVLNVFQNPGQAIYDEIINLVKFAVGGVISGALNTFLNLTGLDDDFKALINNAIMNNSVLSNIFDAGRDVRDVVANLEVNSELVIGKLSSSYEFRGTDNWLGINLYWRRGCDANSPPDCGQIPITADSGSEFANLGVLSSNWMGRVVAYDQLQIDQHPITLRYGRLIIYVLNEVILPAVTNGNANSLSEAFAYWINCGGLATSVTGSDGKLCALGACIYATDIENFCSGTVSTLFGFADSLVRNLEFDIGLKVGGEAKLIEEDSDGFVDRMEEGTFTGYVTGSSNNNGGNQMLTSPVTATWTAEKIDYNTTGL